MDALNTFFGITLLEFADTSITVGQVVGVVLLVLGGSLFVVWSARFLGNSLRKKIVNQDLIQMLSRAWLIVGFIVLTFITLDMLSVPLTAFAFVSGAVAIGVGFGAQNIINNFISGWILMWERPIKLGDFLEMGDVRGTVEAINTRSARIRRMDGVHMLVPNSYLLENTVTNWTLTDPTVRTSVIVGVAYGSDVQLVSALLEQAADENPYVLTTSPKAVVFEDFGDSALIFELLVWVNFQADRPLRMVRSDLRFAIDKLFSENGIVISFPQRDIHVDGSIAIVESK
ncbi:MAG: mechanosensitive ion channel domain-containing protein [Halioglobus sp.]